MVCEVYPGIYLNEIPLPGNPLKSLNSYILTSKQRNLIIDTGFNLNVCKEQFIKGVEKLHIDLCQTDLVLTHMHSDHSGLADDLNKLGVRTFIGKKDGELMNFVRISGQSIYKFMNNALTIGDEDFSTFKLEFGKSIKEPLQYIPLTEGDIIPIGSYLLEVINIPGHTPGHIGLYERNHKLFFCGDQILNEITPNITFYGYDQDVLGFYLDSLDIISELNVDYVFPGHRTIIRNHSQRIKELKMHHQERLSEIINILGKGKKTVSETASEMQWGVSYNKWEDFPQTQKWFASGEAMAHLEHLAFRGIAQRVKDNNGLIYYKIK
ncbi:MAG: Zn-dependent hydrolase [Gracilibacter sp. BRH_c7a]|nr:MAG: Zn-dependent hydrolase [Gracilibacter sp. BRH_c7a]